MVVGTELNYKQKETLCSAIRMKLLAVFRSLKQERLCWGQDWQLHPLLCSMEGAGGARIFLHTELFPSLLPCKGEFSGVVEGLVEMTLSKGKPPDPQLTIVQP